MSLHKLTAGDGYTYLTRQVAAADASSRGRQTLGEYYAEKGESPGRWLGAGARSLGVAGVVTEPQMVALFGEGRHPDADRIQKEHLAAGHGVDAAVKATQLGRPFAQFAPTSAWPRRLAQAFGEFNVQRGHQQREPLTLDDRAVVRTELARQMFEEEHGHPPADPRELSGFIARASRPAHVAVAGYDLTFSPVKSVSTLWAVAPRVVSEAIAAAHHAAVDDTVRWLESEAVYTRVGAAGVRQVDVRGLLATAFVHRDSRAGDPDLHTHVAISNKVQTADGRWLALDGRVLYKANVAASERYNTRLESELGERLSVTFGARPGGDPAKRVVREIVGADERLMSSWSRRRQSIDDRRAELTTTFQRDHGRPPTASESIALAEQANLDTRGDKHEPRSLAEQRSRWQAEAHDLLGVTGVAAMLATAIPSSKAVADRMTAKIDVDSAARDVVEAVSARRATWQTWHVRAEAERRVRVVGAPRGDVDGLVEQVVEAALTGDVSVPVALQEPAAEPVELQRINGESVYSVHGATLFTSAAVLAAEGRILEGAHRTDGRRVDERFVAAALGEHANNGLVLNTGQATLVRNLATSGARVQLALAPAGTGKTTAMKALASAWQQSGGTVVGLAPSAAAASELAASIGFRADTLDKLVWHLRRPAVATPDWVSAIDSTTLIVIDEAGMASTANLDAAIEFAIARSASVRLVGDDRQLAAVAAGGVLRDIQSDVGAATLHEVVRFTHAAEGPVSLALRQGDTSAVAFYLDHNRVHAGTPDTVMGTAYEAWTADRRVGLDSIMLAPRVEQVAVLNAQARADRLTATGEPAGRSVALADGTELSEGDTIITRRNERRLPLGHTDFVRNGYRWTVRDVRDDGTVQAVQHRTGKAVQLPPAYVGEWVRLGYATTIHGAQGITVDSSHTVVDPTMTRDLLYVAATRGRERNEFHVPVVANGGEHEVIRPETRSPSTAAEILTAIVQHDGSQVSATSTMKEVDDPRTRLATEVAKYQDAVTVAAEESLGGAALQRLEYGVEWIAPGVTEAPAWPTLRARLAVDELANGDALQRLGRAKAERPVEGADDLAALLEWRMADASRHGAGPLPWVTGHNFIRDERWSEYLDGVSEGVTALAREVRDLACSWETTPVGRPAWVGGLPTGAESPLTPDLAVWRAATGVDDEDLRPTGPRQFSGALLRAQRELDDRLDAAGRESHGGDVVRWAELGRAVGQGVTDDPYWPVLAQNLSRVERAGLDGATLVRLVTTESLPDELPAAALWWRITAHLSPDVAAAPMSATPSAIVPSWESELIEQLGADRVQALHTDPMWPALVAASDRAMRDGWAVVDLYRSAGDGDAEALLWRIGAATDPEPLDAEQLPLDPDEVTAPSDPDPFHLSAQAVIRRTPEPESNRLEHLQQQLAMARSNLRQLQHDVMRDQGPHMTALRPMLLELRREADRMAPLLAERAFARSDALDADIEVALTRSALREADAPDSLDALTTALERAETLAAEVHSYVAELEVTIGSDLANGPEDPTVAAEVAFGVARDLDAAVLGASRADVDALDADVFRAGLAAHSEVSGPYRPSGPYLAV